MNGIVRRSLFALLCTVFAASDLAAHALGVSRGEYRVEADGASVALAFAGREIATSLPELDRDQDGEVSAAELDAGELLLSGWIRNGITLRSGARDCDADVGAAQRSDNDGLELNLRFHCTQAPAYQLRFDLVAQLTPGHRHIATITSGESVDTQVLFRANATLDLSAAQADLAVLEAHGETSAGWPLVKLGIEHIVTGYDHLVFLFGLILVAVRLRSLVLVVTAFTLGHSVTLAIATLGLWMPSGDLIEPLIALSIVYVGIENHTVRDQTRRWPLTFAFGLIHGFGFAGVLREIGLPQHDLPLALLSFNAGVELGQLAILLLVLPIIHALRQRPWFTRAGVPLLNLAIAAAGTVWFVDRIG